MAEKAWIRRGRNGGWEAATLAGAPNRHRINACANHFTGTKKHADYRGRWFKFHRICCNELHKLDPIKGCKQIVPFLAAPLALLLSQGQAKAVLIYNIFETGGDVVVQASGSLDLTGAIQNGTAGCGITGGIDSSLGVICSGPNITSPQYRITGPSTFDGTVSISPASSVSGITASFSGSAEGLLLDSAYISNSPIVSSATFYGETLASLGFTISSGLIGTWSLNGTSETIQVFLGLLNPPSAVPGPLPLLGAAAAFGWSRRLRKRIATPSITPPWA